MERLIAKDLLSIQAVFLRPDQPFIWASGIKSPIYCDNRLTLSYPLVRRNIEQALAKIIKQHYPECQMVMGTATAGIAHAALVAEILDLPMGYVRASSKEHGRNNQIEGKCDANTKVVVIEDLISTAGSSLEVVQVLKDNGIDVLGIASIFTYGMKKGIERLASAQVRNISATNLDTLLEVAVEMGYIKPQDQSRLLAFRDNPSDESWMNQSAL
ncbi:MAG: orotate phosphoribosyltransferase [Erysipelotrichaceae bacterium]|nr:orotate phosphoribosyltransferase [Erysipelotrichaceae bacterium]